MEWRLAMLFVFVFVVVGCGAIQTDRSVSVGEGQPQVRAKLGAPRAERKLADGQQAWYYPTGPSGFYTWRVVFGPEGQVLHYAQVLTAQNFIAMRDGTTREEVLNRVGPPMQRMDFARTGTEAMTYRWLDGTLEMIADVVLDTASNNVKYVAIYRDPAFTSTPSSSHR
jgi:hypothetical protein